jgi:hypothetical protein
LASEPALDITALSFNIPPDHDPFASLVAADPWRW